MPKVSSPVATEAKVGPRPTTSTGEPTARVPRSTLPVTADRLAEGLRTGLGKAGIEATVGCEGTLVGLHLGPVAPTDYDGARRTDEATYRALFHAMLERGVAVAPGAYEVLFPGLAHTDEVIDEAVERIADAAQAVAAAL